jgi:hypothetical protein
LTVADLIKELQKFPQDHRVFYVEGLMRHTEVSAAGTDRIQEPTTVFQQTVSIEMPSSAKEIDAVILK